MHSLKFLFIESLHTLQQAVYIIISHLTTKLCYRALDKRKYLMIITDIFC